MSTDRIELLINHLDAHRDPTSIPASARLQAKTFLFDSLGVALSGAAVSEATQVLQTVRGWGSGSDARIWGSTERLPAPSAALMNALHIHNQEFDCVHERAVVHPMAVIFAALMAYAERQAEHKKAVSGPQLLAALTLAVDVATIIGMSATKPIRFFRPAMCGSLGATAGMAVLGGSSTAQMRDAFGIAYSQLAGTMQAHIEGTPMLALQVGLAAQSAVCAVDLAAVGFRGPHQVLDGKHGYFTLFEADAAPDAAFAEIGKVWQIERVSHKPFPTGRAAHGGIAGIRALMLQHGFKADDVAEIVLAAPPLIRQLVDRPMLHSMNVSYARLCFPFLAAVALECGTVNLDAYKPENLVSARLLSLSTKVKLVADGNQNPNALAPQHLMIKLNNESFCELAIPAAFGAPEAPMSWHDQRAKFEDCCRHAPNPLTETEIDHLVQMIRHIEQLDDVSKLLDFTVRK